MQLEMVVPVVVFMAVLLLLHRPYRDVDDWSDEEFGFRRFKTGVTRIICCLCLLPIDFRIDLIHIKRSDWGLVMKGAISARNCLNNGPLIFGATPNSSITLSICCPMVE